MRIQQVTDDIAESLNIKPPHGALVAGVDDKGPAKPAGIEAGDVVVKFDGRDIKEMHDLPRIVADTPVGKEVDVVDYPQGQGRDPQGQDRPARGRREGGADAAKRTRRRAEDGGAEDARARTFQHVRRSAQEFKVRDNVKGVVITGVDGSVASPAADKRLSPGDVIVEVQYQASADPTSCRSGSTSSRTRARRSRVLLVANGDGETRFVALNLQ